MRLPCLLYTSEQITPGIIKETKIEAAQERYIRPAFGEMYNAMTEGRYPEFVNTYLKPALAYRCV